MDFSVGNGLRASNSRELILEHDGSSLQIEGDPERASEVNANFADHPKDVDFLAIDIDGTDAYVWRAIQSFRPKVVRIETNSLRPPPQRRGASFAR